MVLGITGGIGSGKSFVLSVLEKEYGFRVLETDKIAKELMQPGEPVYHALLEAFGDGILAPDGKLDKKAYGRLIYESSKNRRRSDEIVHPAVWDYVEAAVKGGRRLSLKTDAEISPEAEDAVQQTTASEKGADKERDASLQSELKFAVETALPSERFLAICDTVWFVYAEEKTRIKRLCASRGYEEEEARQMIRSQLSDSEFMDYGALVLNNSHTEEETRAVIERLLLTHCSIRRKKS